MDYYSKTGYSLSFLRREIIWSLIGGALVIFLILILFPSPANYYIALVAFGITFLFFVVFILFNKFVIGVIVKVEGKVINVYRAQSFTLKPEENEINFFFAGKEVHASLSTVKENIKNVRRIENKNEIQEIKKIYNVLTSVGGILLNKSSMEKISFASDYNNLVELELKNLRIKYLSSFSGFVGSDSALADKVHNIRNAKVLVSVKNPEEFINHLKKYSS